MEIVNLDGSVEHVINGKNFIKSYYGNNEMIEMMFNTEILFERYITKHTNGIIPKINSIFIHKDLKRIYFEKIDGKDLSKLDLYKYNYKEKLTLYYNILISFEKLHSIGVIHNDINLKNIIVCEENIYIVDFSESVFLFNNNELKKYISYTKSYSSIEKYSKYNKSTVYTDIYSLISILYYFIFGFELNESYNNNLKNIVFYDKQVERILKKGLSNNPMLRFKNVYEIRNEIGRLIEKI